jgi:AcrR family transcriptional regulator
MPRLPQSEEERAQNRNRILEAARTLFDEDGIEAVSMRAIGRRVGLTASALYAYFPGKSELVRDIWSDAEAGLTHRLRAISAAHSDPLEAIRALGAVYAAFGIEDPLRFRVLFLWNDESLKDEFYTRVENQSGYFALRDRVAEAMERGLIAGFDDADLVAQTMWAAVHGVVVLNNTCSDFPFRPPELLVSTVMDAIIAGICPGERERR